MAVDDECKLKFLELKAKRNYRYITFKIEEQKVMIDKIGGPNETYEDFTNSLPGNECRYAVFDFDFTTDENCQKSKIFFIAWYLCNNTACTHGFLCVYLFSLVDIRTLITILFQVTRYIKGEDEDGVCEF